MWNPSEREWIKYNFDDYSKGNLGLARAGGLIRNHLGDYIISYGKNVGIYSNNKAEAMSSWGGIKLLRDLGFQKFILEEDSKLIVDILKGDSDVPWEIRDIMDKCKMHMQFFTHYRIQHVYREGNFFVDITVNEALKYSIWSHWSMVSFQTS